MGPDSPYGMNENNIIAKKVPTAQHKIPFIVPFSEAGLEASRIVRKHFTDIKSTFETVFDDHDMVTAFQRQKNLKGFLVSSKL